MTPDVTVVIPVFNTVDYLPECLDSLLQQTLLKQGGNLQIVAVDDGSTDGSADLLDAYAVRHPGLVEVIHQANSGGPASPCNRGLETARGRYVFFLGSDDYLGVEALERLVNAGDQWQADVVACRLVGVGGRHVNDKVYAETLPQVKFPDRLLSHMLSNTKLFRREVLETHGVRYSLDLRVGSDQPFTVTAMRHARRIAVLGDYDYYYAVKRGDASNITYSSSWRDRLQSLTAIVAHLADQLPDQHARDMILTRHFELELSTLLRRDFPELDAAEQAELVDALAGVAERYLTDPIRRALRVPDRLRWHHVQRRDVAELAHLVGAENPPVPLAWRGQRALLAYPGYGVLPDELFEVVDESVKVLALRATSDATLQLTQDRLAVEARVTAMPSTRAADAPIMDVVLVPAPGGRSKPTQVIAESEFAAVLTGETSRHGDRIRSVLPLASLATRAHAQPREWALRWRLSLGHDVYSVPVRVSEHVAGQFAVLGATFQIETASNAAGRALVRLRRED